MRLICQPLDVAVFQPTKIEWKEILDTWHRESKCMDNLPKMVFLSLLCKLMRRLRGGKTWCLAFEHAV